MFPFRLDRTESLSDILSLSLNIFILFTNKDNYYRSYLNNDNEILLSKPVTRIMMWFKREKNNTNEKPNSSTSDQHLSNVQMKKSKRRKRIERNLFGYFLLTRQSSRRREMYENKNREKENPFFLKLLLVKKQLA